MVFQFLRRAPDPVPEQKASATGRVVAWGGSGRVVWSPRDTVSLTRSGFQGNPVGFRVVRLISEAAAALPLIVQDADRRDDLHPLAELIARPNAAQGRAELFEALYGFLLLTGNAYVEAVPGLRALAKSMVDSAYSVASRPIQQGMGDLLAKGVETVVSGIMPFASGAGFTQGRIMPFASGGVVSGPVTFPMRGGTGLMGEAGAEAIMPLARGSDGRLGVRAAGGGRPVTVVMNIQTPDVQGFQRSQSQVAAQAARAMARGQRNR